MVCFKGSEYLSLYDSRVRDHFTIESTVLLMTYIRIIISWIPMTKIAMVYLINAMPLVIMTNVIVFEACYTLGLILWWVETKAFH